MFMTPRRTYLLSITTLACYKAEPVLENMNCKKNKFVKSFKRDNIYTVCILLSVEHTCLI